MSDEVPQNKPGPKKGAPRKKQPYSPEVKGRFVRGPLDWSLDELIEYKEKGGAPMRIPDKEMLFKLGKMGVSLANAAVLFNISQEKFCSNLDWYENWERGRAACGAQIRASIVEDALEKDVLNAKIYIDKILGGDKVVETVQVDVRNAELLDINTEDLLQVMFKTNEPKRED